jgi:serine/alanine adding enzyme
MMVFEVIELSQTGCDKDWRDYVESAPKACFYHALQWRDILLRSFGHRSWYLMGRNRGKIYGVLPLIEMKSALFGHFMVSLPFLDYGGILSDEPECEMALASAAVDLARGRGVRHIELRQSSEIAKRLASTWQLRQHKAALVIPLASDPATHWSDLSSRLRGKVRKAEKCQATFLAGGPERLDDFYRVFGRNMRDLGTPVYSLAFFRNVLRSIDDAAILLVYRGGVPAAAAIGLRRGERVELPWICSDYSQSSYYVNEFLYWNVISWACRSGVRELDLGRCAIDAGTYRFKIQWNPEVRPLYWYYWLAPGAELPNLTSTNRKYALAVRAWKKMPLKLANRVGPLIVRNIP